MDIGLRQSYDNAGHRECQVFLLEVVRTPLHVLWLYRVSLAFFRTETMVCHLSAHMICFFQIIHVYYIIVANMEDGLRQKRLHS
jgi:hypothetical protein